MSAQLDLLVAPSWSALRSLCAKTEQCPSTNTANMLATHEQLQSVFSPLQSNDAAAMPPSLLESPCKSHLCRAAPSRDTGLSAIDVEGPVKHQHSLPIPGCLPKHCRKRPAIRGSGCTGAALSNTDALLSCVEHMLCCHAWCHYSHQLPRELQEDCKLVDFASRMVVQCFDSILYRGDDTTGSHARKIHTQLHNSRMSKCFGDLQQCNTSMGERGLKVWAK